MLTDSELKSKVDTIWDRLWSAGLSNPMDSIEQFSYLLFLKRLDDAETKRQNQAKRRNQTFQPQIPTELRWSEWVKKRGADALKHVKEEVFPWLREVGEKGSSFRQYMEGAEFKLSKPGTLIEVCNLIDQMKISEQNQDVQGDLYEYLLSKLSVAGRNGQFRTPRHIIRMMVEMIAPQPTERIGDLAAGTCGFLVNAYEYILEQYTSPEILYGENGQKHLVGDRLSPEQGKFLQTEAFTAYDNDSGMDYAADRVNEPDAARDSIPPIFLQRYALEGIQR
ncbi:MAG: type I restriction-modification system subunit M N-terminal domain-containing protein [Scytolyngbya sp. HA4215-MV1]|jgi:type I restriction enzyme M protein|nr:type I restriction-modification system subunit M N-terminal domain-containing protein [Scytolyngbya sp. HA4215-MV1]